MIAYILFLCGFVYYCIIPLAIIQLFPENDALGFIKSNYNEAVLIEYLAYASIFFVGFSVGFFFKFKLNDLALNNPRISKSFEVLLALTYALLFFNIFSLSEVLNILGYLEGYDIERRGRLSTLFLTSIWWYIYLEPCAKFSVSKTIFLLIVIFSGLNLLTLGSRLAVVTGVIMIFLNRFPNLFVRLKINIPLAIIGVLILAGIFGAVGVLRESGELNYNAILFIIFAEPVFIFASVFSYFDNVLVMFINFPYDVFTSIAASIPSFVFENKVEFFAKYPAIPDFAQSGFGGANQIVIMLANFGSLIFPFVSLALGWLIASLVNNINKSRFTYTVAIGIVSLIPFIFFRDGYQTSIKLSLMNFFIIPGAFLYVNNRFFNS